MNDPVFPRGCVADRDGVHNIASVYDQPRGAVVLYCVQCGDAVPLSVAIARTPTPTTGIVWPVQDNPGSGASA